MMYSRLTAWLLMSAAMLIAFERSASAQPALPPLPTAGGDDFEVYTRGTLHEAFATPASNDVVIPPLVPKAPPQMIEELPPDQQPEGENVTWISGYWTWDEELDDYIWISGLWRDVPPDRQWVPGYWAQTPDGFQWVAGMWIGTGPTTLVYLPSPPASLERGPSIEAPGPDYFYVPGCWEFQETRYVWRTGYWAPRQRDWIWVPAHYVHTPYGVCYVAGHWDFALIDRGLCYAPVRFAPGRPAVVYRPTIVIDTWDSLVLHLWVDQRRGVYAYGNYYEAPAARYVPWYEHRGPAGGRDPLFAYYEWRNGPEYRGRLSGWHDHFVSNRDWRPPATFREQARYVESRRTTNINVNLRVAVDITKIDRDRDRDRDLRLPVALKEVSRDDDSRYREQARSWVTASQKRREFEAAPPGRDDNKGRLDRPEGGGQQPRHLNLDLPKAVAAAEREEVRRPETPDKLRDVAPDKPRGDVVRLPSKRREQRPVQVQGEQAATVASPTDVPPPPPGRDGDSKAAAKEDRPNRNPRDSFGLGQDTPSQAERDKGRSDTPDRSPARGRAQTDPNKPLSDSPENEPAPPRRGDVRDDASKPEPPRPSTGRPDSDDKDVPRTRPSQDDNPARAGRGSERSDVRKPEDPATKRTTPDTTPTPTPTPNLPPSRSRPQDRPEAGNQPDNGNRPRPNRDSSDEDRGKSPEPRIDRSGQKTPDPKATRQPTPRQPAETDTNRPGATRPTPQRPDRSRPDATPPGTPGRTPNADTSRDRGTSGRPGSDARPPRGDPPKAIPRKGDGVTPPAANSRPAPSASGDGRNGRDAARKPNDKLPAPVSRPPVQSTAPNRPQSGPSTDRRPAEPGAGTQPRDGSRTDPNRREPAPRPNAKPGDAKGIRPRVTVPEKPRGGKPVEDSTDEEKNKKEKAKDQPKAPA